MSEYPELRLDPRPPGGMATVLKAVAVEYGLAPHQIMGGDGRRTRGVLPLARHDFMWRCRQVRWPDGALRYSLHMVGDFLNMHHSSVVHGARKHAARLAELREAA